MSIAKLLSRVEDVERDVGALSMKLQAADDLVLQDFADAAAVLSGSVDDLEQLVDDAEAYYDSLTFRLQEGLTGGRVQELLGHLEDAGQALLDASGYLKASNVDEATCSLDRACDHLTDAMKV